MTPRVGHGARPDDVGPAPGTRSRLPDLQPVAPSADRPRGRTGSQYRAGPPCAARRRWPHRRTVLTAGLAGVVMAGAAGTYHALDPGGSAAVTTELAAYRDAAGGFEVSHPAGWAPSTTQRGVRFRQASSQNAISVEKVTLARPVDPSNLDAVRAVTDAVLSRPSAPLTVPRSGAATIGGLPGVYYAYWFPTSSGHGAHSHYFVFDRRAMYTLVMQAVPAAGFETLAPIFDAVAGSFRLPPGRFSPTLTSEGHR